MYKSATYTPSYAASKVPHYSMMEEYGAAPSNAVITGFLDHIQEAGCQALMHMLQSISTSNLANLDVP